MRTTSIFFTAACAATMACAPPDELGLGDTAEHRDITTTTRQLAVDLEISSDVKDDMLRTVTLALDDVIVWSCDVAGAGARDRVPECTDDDRWYRGPGLYTFAMGDDMATDVWVREDTIRLELRVAGTVDNGALDLWHVSASAYADGNDFATLQQSQHRSGAGLAFVNESGADLFKEAMTAGLEKWDGETSTWHIVPRAPMFLCGTGWNPLMRADEEDFVYLPLGAHQRAMTSEGVDTTGTYRVSYPFRLTGEDEPRIARMILELDESSFGQ